jgi:hypothetical protein
VRPESVEKAFGHSCVVEDTGAAQLAELEDSEQ